jgi:hypothetical protein
MSCFSNPQVSCVINLKGRGSKRLSTDPSTVGEPVGKRVRRGTTTEKKLPKEQMQSGPEKRVEGSSDLSDVEGDTEEKQARLE